MNDQELIQKLHLLGEIKPKTAWKDSARSVLLNQVSHASVGAVKITLVDEVVYNTRTVLAFFSRPLVATLSIMLVLVSGGLSVKAAFNAKPGDSLYATKTLGDKVQLLAVRDKEQKAKLGMKLASARAQEISAVLADSSFTNDSENKAKVEKLSATFNEEINTVKANWQEVSNIKGAPVAVVSPVATDDNAKVSLGGAKKDEVGKVYSVESGKDNKGVQIYVPTEVKNVPVASNIDTTLAEAQKSFATNDFAAAKDSLQKVNVIIDNIDKTVEATTTATSTKVSASSTSVKK